MSAFIFPAHIAMEYHEIGFNVIPMRGKRPIVEWAQWQHERQSRTEVERLFRTHIGNAAVVLGCVNDQGLYPFAIDVEQRALFDQWSEHASNTWLVSSYRGGHIYGLSAEPVIPQKHRAYEIRSVAQLINVPISRHPKGGTYMSLTSPQTLSMLTSLAFLPAPLHVETRTHEHTRPATRKPLTRFAIDMLAGRIPMLRWRGDRSAADMALMNSLVACGLELDECRALFLDSQHDSKYQAMLRGTDKYKSRAFARHADMYLERTFDKALERKETQQARYALTVADAMMLHAERAHWGARTSDKRTLIALATIVRQTRSLDIEVGRRELSEMAEVDQKTASTSLKRHIKAGRIGRKRGATICVVQTKMGMPERIMRAAAYRIGDRTFANEIMQIEKGARSNLPQTTQYYGVFEQAGLGRTARNIYEHIVRSMTIAEMVRETQHTRLTVQRHLSRMIKLGIVRKTNAEDAGQHFVDSMGRSYTLNRKRGGQFGSGARYERVPEVDWLALGRRLRTAAIGARRKAKHDDEYDRFMRLTV